MYRTIKFLILPPSLLLFALILVVALMWWKKAAKKRWLICISILIVLLYVSSSRVITRYMVGSLEWAYPQQESMPEHADLIVVLGGGCRYYGPDNDPPYELNEFTTNRTRHAAKVYHKVGGCPIVVVSGTDSRSRDPEKRLAAKDPIKENAMSRFLLELGVDRNDITLEEESRDTYENAFYTKELVKEKGYKDIVLVTDAAHMYRSELCFKKVGLEVTPAACNYCAQALEFSPYTLLPNDEGLRQSRVAVREYIALLWYWLRGRIY